MQKGSLTLILALLALFSQAQPDRWQQRVKYKMDIDMDVNTNRFTGKQELEYTNNSPDTLKRIYYHLYWNAFQPNSNMDQRSRELGKISINNRPDWDQRVKDRILNLKPDEIGYQKIQSLKMNGVEQKFTVQETILVVDLSRPILPHSKVTLNMDFEAQVPLQVRRAGRDNPNTGVRYSMSQWYPKLCEYDYEGWHPTLYVAREFYGVWGDFDVTIRIDKNYTLGGTGYLQNPNAIGHGYETPGAKLTVPNTPKLAWRFVAPEVHDFMWAADPEYKHLVRQVPNGPTIHVLYNYKENDAKNDEAWNRVADAAVEVLPFIEKNFGKYPYKQYSFIHGGDGGMEYPMSTLISGPSLGTAFHEWMHTWYQMLMGTNESLYAWMDEGFTSYAESLVSEYYAGLHGGAQTTHAAGTGPAKGEASPENIHKGAYDGYFYLVKSGREEPMTTHADHFETNMAYSIAAYSKGEVFLEQLGYITGASVRDAVLLDYYRLWHFKHPNVNDFIRVAENRSGIQLDWYREYWVNTTKTIDYGVDSLYQQDGATKIRLKRTGKMPMPVDVVITFKDGSKELHYVPLDLMFGGKPEETPKMNRTVYQPWKWTQPQYEIQTKKPLQEIVKVEIDPSQRMADVNRKDNLLELTW
ncbi:M1 family metallopeptidase [Flavihumibacter petaseus]|uniref:Peptidase M1 family protein n=1 Tax=Flavihumibacter petaseus NBRC 106054 TaxID=1220578 RepID=A0A0E9MU31_9BACT|nr:M1 family metallopeptidase [Flavihumibacter petaseus]GAO41282.1 peptidase M1 family protein [Flavihumibacter petaseus NBRC 106054]